MKKRQKIYFICVIIAVLMVVFIVNKFLVGEKFIAKEGATSSPTITTGNSEEKKKSELIVVEESLENNLEVVSFKVSTVDEVVEGMEKATSMWLGGTDGDLRVYIENGMGEGKRFEQTLDEQSFYVQYNQNGEKEIISLSPKMYSTLKYGSWCPDDMAYGDVLFSSEELSQNRLKIM